MLKVLINAYACSPNMGSEPGMAWNWCVNLAKYCELEIITEGEFRDKIEEVLPNIPQGKNMHFHYLPIGSDDKESNKIRKRCWNQGDWRFYLSYAKWQKRALLLGRRIIKEHHIDIVHQLNMIGFREPGQMWNINNIPYIWGPTNAKEGFPVSYLYGASWKSKVFIYLKNAITKFQLLTSKKVHRAAQRASFVVAASSDSAKSIKKYLKVNPIIINESGCEVEDKRVIHNFDKETLDLLWVGRFIFTKQLPLALRTLKKIDNKNVRLHIVGGSLEEEKTYKELAEKLGIADSCVWHEKVSHEEVQTLMQKCDVFFFTSIAEGTPHVVLEAFNNGLPVVCFDTCGHGDCVNDKVGIKISLSNSKQSVEEFAHAINRLYDNRKSLEMMSRNCLERTKELSWDNKARQMVKIYQQMTINAF
jgi:glycosyltransferase involved in cell wall biosynthesis